MFARKPAYRHEPSILLILAINTIMALAGAAVLIAIVFSDNWGW